MAKRRELKVYVQQRGGMHRTAEVEKLVRHCVGEMFSTRMANTLRITIKLRATTMNEDRRGEANFRRIENPKAKHYTITVQRDLSWAQTCKTVAHEIRHVHQYATKRLRHGTKGGVHGRFWRPSEGRADFFAYNTIAYADMPWEHEARDAEKIGTKFNHHN